MKARDQIIETAKLIPSLQGVKIETVPTRELAKNIHEFVLSKIGQAEKPFPRFFRWKENNWKGTFHARVDSDDVVRSLTVGTSATINDGILQSTWRLFMFAEELDYWQEVTAEEMQHLLNNPEK